MCDGVESDRPGACPMCGMALERNPAFVETHSAVYTCPMHPEVRENRPGACPVCGMALEPVAGSAAPAEEENAELREMTRRFWIGLGLTVPVLVLSMGEMVPVLGDEVMTGALVKAHWLQFFLSTPVVLWAGWPFLARGARSLVTRRLNMFTLIALGTGTAYLYSVAGTIFPFLFPNSLRSEGVVQV